ncbi:MAG: histidinol dehydrogenase [Bacillota bacterium]|nr:histidinol dehydrogenase [Bacillota bacterium]
MFFHLMSFEQYKDKLKTSTFSDFSEEFSRVRLIIDNVRQRGDQALYEYALKFDQAKLDSLVVSKEEIKNAVAQIDPELLKTLDGAKENIELYHRRQLREDWWESGPGWLTGQRVIPLQAVGAYVPGGTAAYPSSVLMTVLPARVAGVEKIYICTPPDKHGKINPVTLAAAEIAGASAVFKIGGAQAVAALAYGTETVPRVQKIVGPGNIYVTLAKKEVFGQVGIDMLAGPSEIVIVADNGANADFIAADLLSQAEHDPLSRSILVSTSENLANRVAERLEEQILTLPRKEIAGRSLRERGGAIIVPSLEEAWPVVNEIAPEHLELHLEEAWRYLEKITSAGAIFIGSYSPEPLGDYWAGSNHVLPTGAAARYASPLGVDDYMKKSSVIYYSKDVMKSAAGSIAALARAEGLEAHARAALIRRY